MGLVAKELICSNSTYTTEYVDERLMAIRFEISSQSGAVNFVFRTHQPKSARTKPSKRSGIDLTVSYSGYRQRSVYMF